MLFHEFNFDFFSYICIYVCLRRNKLFCSVQKTVLMLNIAAEVTAIGLRLTGGLFQYIWVVMCILAVMEYF